MQPNQAGHNTLSLATALVYLVIYLSIIQGGTALLMIKQAFEYATYPNIEVLLRSTVIPVAASVVFVTIIITRLGWWQRIWVERNPLPRLFWLFPLLMIISILLVTDYAQLMKIDTSLLATLLLAVVLIGIGEELMFRGLILETLREGTSRNEFQAAMLMAALFGGAHITNIFTEGSTALIQVFITALAGLLYYIILRLSGSLLLPVLLHAAWDFSLFSSKVGENPQTSELAGISLLTIIVLSMIVFIKRKVIWQK